MAKRDKTETVLRRGRAVRSPRVPAASEHGTLVAGARAGEYQIEAVLGAGGCGTVYRARHRVLGRVAAVKVLHARLAASDEMVERFVREARAVNLIRHPGLVDIIDLGRLDDGRPYSVMELCEGESLDRRLEREGSLWPREALALLEPLCAALHAAHEHGIVHRDLKASNVMIVEVDGAERVKLSDFGIAKLLAPDEEEVGLSVEGRRLGTPHAMAPEQIRGAAVDRRADVYALGVLLYQLLTGRYPFDADDATEVERLHVTAPPPRPSRVAPVSSRVDAVVLRAMAKAPADRFATVLELLETLRAAVLPATPRSGAPAAQGVSTGTAIYVEARLAPTAIDDASVTDLGRVVELAAGALRQAGCVIALETGSSVMGVLLGGEPGAPPSPRAVELAEALERRLTGRAGADPRLRLGIIVHADRVVVRDVTGGRRLIGGPIVQVEAWAPRPERDGLVIT